MGNFFDLFAGFAVSCTSQGFAVFTLALIHFGVKEKCGCEATLMLTIFQFINMVYFVQHVHGAPRKRIKSGFAYEKVSPLLYNFIHFAKRTENKKTANKTYTNFSFRVLFETVRSEKLRCTIERGDERSKLIDTLFGREINNIILLTARQQSAKCVKLAIGFND